MDLRSWIDFNSSGEAVEAGHFDETKIVCLVGEPHLRRVLNSTLHDEVIVEPGFVVVQVVLRVAGGHFKHGKRFLLIRPHVEVVLENLSDSEGPLDDRIRGVFTELLG